MGDKEFKLVKLEKDNYVVWKWQFKNVLRARKLMKVFDEGCDDPSQNQALALLGSALSEENMLRISNCDTFKEAWRAIERCYENKTTYEPQALYRRLNSFKINTASEVSSGLGEMQGIVAQLKNLGETVSDNCFMGAILSSLPSSFDIFGAVWKNSADKDVDSLISKLMAEAGEQSLKEKDDTKALAVKGQGKKGNKKGKAIDKDQCRYCKEHGHWIQDCPNLKEPYDPNRSKKKSKKNGDQQDDKKDTTQLAFITRSGSQNKSWPMSDWVADSGCTNHMTPFKMLFDVITVSTITNVQLADDMSIKVSGQGEISTKQGKLTNVLYVPDLAQSLFSISAAARGGLSHVGHKDKLTFYHGKNELFKAKLQDMLYTIKFDYMKPLTGKANSATLGEWHARFGHIAKDTIDHMKKNNCVDGLDIVVKRKERCEDCQLNKCTRAHHSTRSTPRTVKPGAVLHVDTAGPSNIVSHGGSKYFVLCKDEASSYRQVAFVASKDQIGPKVKEFISRATLETGNPVLKLMTDNGTEFKGELGKFLQARGIIHETSVAYVPSQNGYIERDIRIVKEAAKTMLNKSKLEKSMWAEAVNCAVYVTNRVTNSSNNLKTPYELWHGHKPNVKNLRIFGELAVIKKPATRMTTTWDEKGTRAAFVGYSDRFNTYRFLEEGKIKVACDVVFLNKLNNGEAITAQIQEDENAFWSAQDDTREEVDEEIQPNNQDDPSDHEDQSAVGTAQHEENFELAPQPPSPQAPQQPTPVVNQPTITVSAPSSVPVPTQQATSASDPVMSREEVQAMIDRYHDQVMTIKNGSTMQQIRIGDIRYSENSGRWKIPSGHFISRATIKDMKNVLDNQPRTSMARALIANAMIPNNYKQAMGSSNKEKWVDAMNDEMDSLKENEVFETVPKSQVGKKPVGSRWVFSIKTQPGGEIDKFKARVVAKGYSQVYGIDYDETYCSVVHILSTRLLLNYAAMEGLQVKQFDVKTAFLYGRLNEEIFMEPPEGYAQEGTLWRLKRSLYGLKQSPRMWNEYFSQYIEDLGFKTAEYDNAIFYRHHPRTFITVYVDDGLIFADRESDIYEILTALKKEFKMREMQVNKYRGLEIVMMDDGVLIHQEKYAKKILDTFNMTNAHQVANPIMETAHNDSPLDPNVPYKSAVSSLAYLGDTTRPDISFAVNRLQRKMAKPTVADWKNVKYLLRYLAGTTHYGIKYSNKRAGDPALVGYSDSDFAGDTSSSKSTTGYLIMFNQAPIHWKAQLQRHVTLSSTEAEVIALCSLTKQLAWIRRMMIELRIIKPQHAIIKCDNTSAMKIVQSEKATLRTRHLRAQDAYVREQIAEDELKLEHVKSAQQLADILTKRVQTGQFTANCNTLMTPM